MRFEDLGLSPEVLRAVADAGYVEPTPIQEKAIPIALQGRDLMGAAQTGTGKTAAFTLPMIDILAGGRAKARMPRSLILTPTRELAMQISENFEIYGKYNKLSMALLIGGVSIGDQERVLSSGVDVLIATPGRLIDLFGRGRILLAGVKILVIDEADRMLDMGFIPDVERIVSLLPPMRQTLFFSATLFDEIRRLADAFLHNPKEVRVDPPASPAETVNQTLIVVNARTKGKLLRDQLGGEAVKNALIFCNRKRDVGLLSRSLKRSGFSAGALHGDMDQGSRTETLEAFKQGDIRFLVATDVAGRGIDIFGLSHVFNYDVPTHAEDYVHRIGRTGRAGHRGRSVTIATPEEVKYVASIERLIGRKIPRIEAGDPPRADTEVAAAAPKAAEAPVAPTEEPKAAATEEPEVTPAEAPAALATEAPEAAAEAPAAPVEDAEPKRGRRRKAKDGETRESKPRDRKPRESKPRERKTERAPSRDRAAEPAADDSANRGQVVGMGDHVPAFMQRPVKRDD